VSGHDITDSIGAIPYRMAFAGGWIDQPFVSRHNTSPPGSMVVVGLEPTFRCMDRAGMATGTRNVAMRLWRGNLPNRKPAELVRELYEAENQGKSEPSGSQDMIGLIYPGVNRLDFDFDHAGGVFPKHIESNNDPAVVRWLENVIHVVPVAPRPEGYISPRRKKSRTRVDSSLGTERQGLLRGNRAARHNGSRCVDERLHEVLGGHPATHRPASNRVG